MSKAQDAKRDTDIAEAKEAAVLKATEYIQEYMDERYVKSNTTVASQTTGAYVAAQMNGKTSGSYTFTTSGMDLTVAKSGTTIVTGTIDTDGKITWDEQEAGGNNQQQGQSNLSQAEQTALAANGMAQLTTAQIDSYVDNISGSELNSDEKADRKNALKDTSKIKAVLTGNVPIPVGYDYVEGTSTAPGVTKPDGGSWGVVVKDSNQNEWVWVPVNSNESVVPSAIYTTDAEGYPMASNKEQYTNLELAKNISGMKIASINELPSIKIASSSSSSSSSSESSINVKSTRRSASNIIRGITRGEDTNREPALLSVDYWSNTGFETIEEMAQAFSDDYNAMISSIIKYGGFYVGRYELSGTFNNAKVQAGQISMDNMSWYNFYEVSRGFATETTTSTMIWGAQWDVLCKWIEVSGDHTVYDEYHSSAHSGNRSVATGMNLNDMQNNVYDLEGGIVEWTQEMDPYWGHRSARGGDYQNVSQENYMSNRGGAAPDMGHDGLGTRPVFYIKE